MRHYLQPKKEAGVALFVSLIVLVAMSIAGIALVRSVDTGSLIASNLAFRQSATLSADAGIEAARAWLLANSGALEGDHAGDGYYATSQDAVDLTGNVTPGNHSDDVDWDGSGGVATPRCIAKDGVGNTVCYMIHRLCDFSGPLDNSCSTQETVRGGSGKGAVTSEIGNKPGSWDEVVTMAIYRVTIRVSGSRNNISFVQAFILI